MSHVGPKVWTGTMLDFNEMSLLFYTITEAADMVNVALKSPKKLVKSFWLRVVTTVFCSRWPQKLVSPVNLSRNWSQS